MKQLKTIGTSLTVYLMVTLINWSGGALAVGSHKFGGGDAGGGVGFKCGSKVYLADTYDMIQSEKLKSDITVNINHANIIHPGYEEVLNLFFDKGSLNQIERDSVKTAIQILHFDNACPVEVTNDHGIVDVPKGCRIVQLASQRNGRVCYNHSLINEMSPIERSLLKIHEGYVYAYKKPGDLTIRIRQMLTKAINNSSFRAHSAPIFLPSIKQVSASHIVMLRAEVATNMYQKSILKTAEDRIYFDPSSKAADAYKYLYKRCIEVGDCSRVVNGIPKDLKVLGSIFEKIKFDDEGKKLLRGVFQDNLEWITEDIEDAWENFIKNDYTNQDLEVLRLKIVNLVNASL